MATLVVLLALALAGTLAACDAAFDLGLATRGILAANAGLAVVGLFFGTLALAAGCATGSVGAARGIPTAAAIGAFLMNALGATSRDLAVLQDVSPLHWYLGDVPPLARGPGPGLALLAAGVVLLLVLAVAAFERKDVVASG
jgi:ABC-2 type transport system permease protein